MMSKALDRVGLDQPPVERHKVRGSILTYSDRWPQDRWDSDGFRSGRENWFAILVPRDEVTSEL